MGEVVEGRTWVLGKGMDARGLYPCEEVELGGREEGTRDLGREVCTGQEDSE